MHGSVLQNEKYIKFAEENTVEVLALGRLNEGISKGDKGAETYKAKDEQGNEAEYMVEWPNLTAAMIADLNTSQAGTYNQSGAIPYTSVVDPHTLRESKSLPGTQAAGSLMDAVLEQKKALNKQHGPSLSRKFLADVEKQEASIRKDLEKGDVVKAMGAYSGLAKRAEKMSASLRERIAKSQEEILRVAGAQLDEADAQIGRGELKEAGATLGKLARALKGTPLEPRANELLEKTKGSKPE
ncbi:MAG: hypothetical protein ACREID_06495 [Planctomycetota bacterium]